MEAKLENGNHPLAEDDFNEEIELKALLEVIDLKSGYDFRNYALSSIKRQVKRRMELEGIKTISQLQHQVLYDRDMFYKVTSDFYINVTELFRDPAFFKSLRKNIVPILKSYPSIKIWHAGCGTGQEVYSMAILLMEEGLFERSRIYATDVNEEAIKKAREGIYPVELIKENTHNYFESGGTGSLTNYCTARYGNVIMKKDLKSRISFFDHNLVTDSSIGEMNLIFCRNVLIYFNNVLKEKVVEMFWESLCHKGFFCAGASERLIGNGYQKIFEAYDDHNKIYRKKEKSRQL